MQPRKIWELRRERLETEGVPSRVEFIYPCRAYEQSKRQGWASSAVDDGHRLILLYWVTHRPGEFRWSYEGVLTKGSEYTRTKNHFIPPIAPTSENRPGFITFDILNESLSFLINVLILIHKHSVSFLWSWFYCRNSSPLQGYDAWLWGRKHRAHPTNSPPRWVTIWIRLICDNLYPKDSFRSSKPSVWSPRRTH